MKRLFQFVALLLIGSLAAAVTAIGAARATMPASTCAVSQEQMDAVKLEISRAEAVARLGCEGVVVSRSQLGDYTFETHAWRGTAWPYGVFKGEFINGRLEGIEKRWISLNLSAN